ncbi:MAG: hypothetical protein ACYC4L_15240 [Chloroflexota bacterium]
MRNLSASLLAAIRSPSRAPLLSLRVEDRPPVGERLEWQDLVRSGPDSNGCRAARLADGRIVRVQLTGHLAPYAIAVCVDSLSGAQNTWVQIATGVGYGQPAVCTWDSSILVAWFHANGLTINWRLSSDAGATWGTVEVVSTFIAPEYPRALALLWLNATDIIMAIAYHVEPHAAPYNDHVWLIRWRAGIWSPLGNQGDLHPAGSIAIASPDANTIHVWTACFSAAVGAALYHQAFDTTSNAWLAPAPVAIHAATPLSATQFSCITGAYLPDGATPRYLLGWIDHLSSGSTPPCQFVYCFTPDPALITVPLSHRLGAAPQFAAWDFVAGAEHVYLVGAQSVWEAARHTASRALDLPPEHILTLDLDQESNGGGHLVVRLDDEGARYAAAGQPGPLRPLRPGSQVILGLGYRGAGGAERSYQADWWLARVHRQRQQDGTAVLVLECVDTWGWLERQTAPMTVLHAGKSVGDIVRRLLATVAARAALPADARLDTVVGALSVDVGERYADPLKRLLRENGYGLRFTTTQTGAGGPANLTATVYDAVPAPLPAPDLDLGPAGIVPLALSRAAAAPQPNHVAVLGLGITNFAYSYDDVEQQAFQRTERWTARHLTTDAATQDVAERLLAWHDAARYVAEVTIPLHPTVEVGDVARLSDAWLGCADTPHLVRALRCRYHGRQGAYTTTLRLESKE